MCNAIIFQAFIVAGGHHWAQTSDYMRSSVITLLRGASAWTALASLPMPLGAAGISIIGGKIWVSAGYDGGFYRDEVSVCIFFPGMV